MMQYQGKLLWVDVPSDTIAMESAFQTYFKVIRAHPTHLGFVLFFYIYFILTFYWNIIHNIKFTILTYLKSSYYGFYYIHNAVQPSAVYKFRIVHHFRKKPLAHKQ